MAKGVTRLIRLVLDRRAAQKAADDLIASLGTAGEQGGKNFYRELKNQFDKRMGELREKLARGIIDEKEFKKQSDLAAKEFNKSLLKSMDEARKKGELTDREYIKLTKSLKNVGKEGGVAGNSLAKTFGKVAGAIGAAFALHRITAFAKSLFTTAAEADAIWNRLDGTLQNAGTSLEKVGDQVQRAARAMQDATTVGDEDFAAILTELVSMSGDYEASLQNVSVVADLAAAKQIDFRTAAQLVGKAMVGETGTLSRYGIIVEDGADAVELMRERFKGLAENEARTLNGQVKQLNNEWGDFKEALGRALAEAGSGGSVMDMLIDRVKSMAGWVETNSGKLQEMGRRLFEVTGRAIKLAEIAAKPFTFTLKALFTPKEWWDSIINNRRFRKNFNRGLDDTSDEREEFIESELAKGGLRRVSDGKRVPHPGEGGTQRVKTKEQLEEERLAREKAAREAEAALAREIAELKQGHDLRLLTNAQIERAIQLQQILAEKARDTSLSLSVRNTAQQQANTLSGITDIPLAANNVDVGLQSTKAADAMVSGKFKPIIDTSANEQLAHEFVSPWENALLTIQEQAEAAGGIFAELGQAWADGGLAGLARFAMGKVKENLAQVVEQGARALAALATGNAPAAAAHGKSAAMHGAAAAAWKLVGGALGGGGGGSRGGGVASLGGSRDNVSDGAARVEPRQEINVFVDGFDPANGRHVRLLTAGIKEAARTDSQINIHPRGN